jgi:hypothetical protein
VADGDASIAGVPLAAAVASVEGVAAGEAGADVALATSVAALVVDDVVAVESLPPPPPQAASNPSISIAASMIESRRIKKLKPSCSRPSWN